MLPDDIPKPDTQIITDHPVHPDLLIRASIVRQDDAHGFSPFLSFQKDRVATEKLQLIHLTLQQKKSKGHPLAPELFWCDKRQH